MRNSIKYQIIISIAIFFSACSDLLNTVPQDFLAPQTYMTNEKEAFLVLTGVYDPISTQAMYGKFYSIDMQNDDLSYQNRWTTTQSPVFNNPNKSDGTLKETWNVLWDGISRANFFLSMIDKPIMDSTKREQFRAEALFLRSFYYYQLVCAWGDVPLRLNVINNLNQVQIARTPAYDVLKQVVRDMETSETSVGKTSDNSLAGSRITQSAVQGILARVYLTMAGAMYTEAQLPKKEMYEKALYWAYQVKKSGLHTLNNKTVTINYADLAASKPAGGYTYMDVFRRYAADELDLDFKESIWEAMMSGNSQDPANMEGQWISTSYGPSFTWDVKDHPSYYSYAFYTSTNTMWNLFTKDKSIVVEDLRLNSSLVPYNYKTNVASSVVINSRSQIDLTITPNDEGTTGFSSTRFIGKYLRQFEVYSYHSKNFTPCNFPLLRYSDVLLMIAEAGIQTRNLGGTIPADIADINMEIYDCVKTVRDRAGVGVTTPMTFSNIDFIIDERARELCFEGLRRQDLIRWGIYIDRMYATKDEMINAAKGVGSSAKAYLEIQLALSDVIHNPLTEAMLYTAMVGELSPVKSFLKQIPTEKLQKPSKAKATTPTEERITEPHVSTQSETEQTTATVGTIFYTVKDLIDMKIGSDRTIRRLLKKKELIGIKQKKGWLVEDTEYQRYFNNLKTKQHNKTKP